MCCSFPRKLDKLQLTEYFPSVCHSSKSLILSVAASEELTPQLSSVSLSREVRNPWAAASEPAEGLEKMIKLPTHNSSCLKPLLSPVLQLTFSAL